MNLSYYSNYVTIVEEGSLTAAARKLRIAQPALSNQIKALEAEYGARLFHRGARRLELTDAGQILYQRAKRMLAIETAARSEIASGFGGTKGTLKIGITSSFENERLLDALTAFSDRFPDAEVRVYEAELPELIKRLQNGKVEAIFVRPIKSDVENLEVLYTRPDTLVAAYRPDAFFADEPEPETSFERLSTLPLSMLERSLPAFSNAFREKGLILSPKYVSTRMQIALNWARAGKAVALAPKSAMEELGFTDLAEKTVEDCDLLVPAMTILTQKRKYRSHLVNNFLLLLSERYGFEYSEPIEGSDNGKGA
ncbi:MAG: LysR family transcriptional regulator [Clostridia bacterium]|nr:LysR family transcriptional regulator [Clostridia bacterium]